MFQKLGTIKTGGKLNTDCLTMVEKRDGRRKGDKSRHALLVPLVPLNSQPPVDLTAAAEDVA